MAVINYNVHVWLWTYLSFCSIFSFMWSGYFSPKFLLLESFQAALTYWLKSGLQNIIPLTLLQHSGKWNCQQIFVEFGRLWSLSWVDFPTQMNEWMGEVKFELRIFVSCSCPWLHNQFEQQLQLNYICCVSLSFTLAISTAS